MKKNVTLKFEIINSILSKLSYRVIRRVKNVVIPFLSQLRETRMVLFWMHCDVFHVPKALTPRATIRAVFLALFLRQRAMRIALLPILPMNLATDCTNIVCHVTHRQIGQMCGIRISINLKRRVSIVTISEPKCDSLCTRAR